MRHEAETETNTHYDKQLEREEGLVPTARAAPVGPVRAATEPSV